MKKVWLVVIEYPLGGAERQIFELASSDTERFQLVDLKSSFTNRIVGENMIIGLNHDILHLNTKNKIFRRIKRYVSLYKLFFIIRSKDIDAVVFYNTVFISLAYWLKLFTNIKIIFSIREYKPFLFRGINLFFLKNLDLLYTNTPRVKASLNELDINCELILNTINDINSNIDTKRNKNKIIVISNLEPHKSIHILLLATKEMNITINIAGKISNLQYYSYCKKIAADSNCVVNFLGAVSQDILQEHLKNATCLVHPSTLEGTSNAILDAISTKTPLLVSDIPENCYLVDDIDLFLFRKNDIEDLKIKLEFLLSENKNSDIFNKLEYLKNRLDIKFSKNNLNKIWQIINKLNP